MTRIEIGLAVALSLASAVLVSCLAVPVDTFPRPCTASLEALLLENSAFPSGWSRAQPNKNNQFSSRAIDQCGTSYYVINGVASEEVYVYKNVEDATHDFGDLGDYLFSKKAPPLPTPQVSTSETDEFRLTCSMHDTIPMCELLARHGLYIVHFNAHMSPSFMTQPDLIQIVHAIDAKMGRQSN